MNSAKTAAERLKEKADRLNAQQKRVITAEHEHVVPVAPLVQTKPVRSSVDLFPQRHATFKAWCVETAVTIGQSRVTTQDVLDTMVSRLLADETFARNIRDDLRERYGK